MPTDRKSLYDAAVYASCMRRLDALRPDMHPQWGSMSPGQMLAHCAEVQEVDNGKALRQPPVLFRLAAPLIQRMARKMLLNDKPFPRNFPTHPQYVPGADPDFNNAMQRLRDALEVAQSIDPASRDPHPVYGTVSPDDRGWLAYKHLDHHLQQFGV